MQSEAEEMSFEEHDFFQDELKENFDKAFSWDTHEAQFCKVKDEISRGTELLREAETRQREADDLLKKRERQQRETDAAQRRESELESVLVQVENEWKEALYSWNGRNEELKFTPEQMPGNGAVCRRVRGVIRLCTGTSDCGGSVDRAKR